MKKILLAFGVLCLNAGLHAQPPGTPKPPTIEERIKHTNDILQKELQLNAKQKVAIEASFKIFFTAEDKLRKDHPATMPPVADSKIKVQMDKLSKERDESIKKVLTDEQYKKYLEAEKKMRPPMPGKNGNGKLPIPNP